MWSLVFNSLAAAWELKIMSQRKKLTQAARNKCCCAFKMKGKVEPVEMMASSCNAQKSGELAED